MQHSTYKNAKNIYLIVLDSMHLNDELIAFAKKHDMNLIPQIANGVFTKTAVLPLFSGTLVSDVIPGGCHPYGAAEKEDYQNGKIGSLGECRDARWTYHPDINLLYHLGRASYDSYHQTDELPDYFYLLYKHKKRLHTHIKWKKEETIALYASGDTKFGMGVYFYEDVFHYRGGRSKNWGGYTFSPVALNKRYQQYASRLEAYVSYLQSQEKPFLGYFNFEFFHDVIGRKIHTEISEEELQPYMALSKKWMLKCLEVFNFEEEDALFYIMADHGYKNTRDVYPENYLNWAMIRDHTAQKERKRLKAVVNACDFYQTILDTLGITSKGNTRLSESVYAPLNKDRIYYIEDNRLNLCPRYADTATTLKITEWFNDTTPKTLVQLNYHRGRLNELRVYNGWVYHFKRDDMQQKRWVAEEQCEKIFNNINEEALSVYVVSDPDYGKIIHELHCHLWGRFTFLRTDTQTREFKAEETYLQCLESTFHRRHFINKPAMGVPFYAYVYPTPKDVKKLPDKTLYCYRYKAGNEDRYWLSERIITDMEWEYRDTYYVYAGHPEYTLWSATSPHKRTIITPYKTMPHLSGNWTPVCHFSGNEN